MNTASVVLPSLTSGLDEHRLTLTQEDILEPLWDRGGHRYLLPEFLADAGSGHRIGTS